MKQMYLLYKDWFEKFPQDVGKIENNNPLNIDDLFSISWSHNKYIIDKCKKDAHYALEGYNNPLGISEYELSEIFPKDFKGTLPSIEDIENVLFN